MQEEAAELEEGEEDPADQVKRLSLALDEERENNRSMVAELSGSAVKYGMVIHLQHVKTGLFVCTQPKMIAEYERSCSAVILQERIASGCIFKVESR